MQTEWIAAGVIAIVVLAWCRARSPERASLRYYSTSIRARLYIPFVPWQDWVTADDHDVLHPLRVRAGIGGASLLALAMTLLVKSYAFPPSPPSLVPDATTPTSPTTFEPQPSRRGVVDPSRSTSTADAGPDPETVRSLRTPIRLYGTAIVKPIYRIHEVEGALITHIDPNSFWAMLGVREGDVVIELHGEPVDDPEVLVALMNALERDEHVEVAVRGSDGEVRYLEFESPNDNK